VSAALAQTVPCDCAFTAIRQIVGTVGMTAYSPRNCLLEVIQRWGFIFTGSFLQETPTKKKSVRLKPGEHGSQIFIEMRQSPRRSLSMFVVSLAVWQVGLSCCNQQSAPSSTNKASNCCTRSLCTQQFQPLNPAIFRSHCVMYNPLKCISLMLAQSEPNHVEKV